MKNNLNSLFKLKLVQFFAQIEYNLGIGLRFLNQKSRFRLVSIVGSILLGFCSVCRYWVCFTNRFVCVYSIMCERALSTAIAAPHFIWAKLHLNTTTFITFGKSWLSESKSNRSANNAKSTQCWLMIQRKRSQIGLLHPSVVQLWCTAVSHVIIVPLIGFFCAPHHTTQRYQKNIREKL